MANLQDSGNTGTPFINLLSATIINAIVNSNRIFINTLAAIGDFGKHWSKFSTHSCAMG